VIPDRVLVRFKGVVDDRANAGVLADRRHSAAQRTLITHEIREIAACTGTGLIDHAPIAIEEHATVFGLMQDQLPVLRIYYGVFPDDLVGRHVQVSGERLEIAARDVYAGFSTTVGTSSAIDLLLHLTSDPAKKTVGNMMRLEKTPKAEVLPSIRFRGATDLDEVGDHASSILLYSSRRATDRECQPLELRPTLHTQIGPVPADPKINPMRPPRLRRLDVKVRTLPSGKRIC
jgi:hypothetical protein